MEQAVQYFNQLQTLDNNTLSILYVACLVLTAVALGLLLHGICAVSSKLVGIRRMQKRAKLSQDVREIIEDHFVSALSEAINAKRITIDEARGLYAKFAHLGFWGLHPRKFQPKKTGLELTELKERLKSRRASRNGASKAEPVTVSAATNKLLDGLTAELA